MVPKRPLPDSSSRRDQRANQLTARVAIGFVLFVIALGVVLFFLA